MSLSLNIFHIFRLEPNSLVLFIIVLAFFNYVTKDVNTHIWEIFVWIYGWNCHYARITEYLYYFWYDFQLLLQMHPGQISARLFIKSQSQYRLPSLDQSVLTTIFSSLDKSWSQHLSNFSVLMSFGLNNFFLSDSNRIYWSWHRN